MPLQMINDEDLNEQEQLNQQNNGNTVSTNATRSNRVKQY